MGFENILVEKREGVAVVTLNRPAKLNALNKRTLDELEEAFVQLRDDPEVAVVILTGSGDRAFAAGADIDEFVDLNGVTTPPFSQRGQRVMNLIEDLGKPVIAAVNGLALGGGCELAMACTLRVASTNARFGLPEVGLGALPGFGGTQRLPRLVGKGRALELILTGDMIDAEEAHRIGLVNKVVPPDQLMDACMKLAKKIMSKAPVSIRMALKAVNAGCEMSLPEALVLESHLAGICMSTQDKEEGIKAFQEKRPPKFVGR